MISNDVKKAFELGKKEGREETKKWIEGLIDEVKSNQRFVTGNIVSQGKEEEAYRRGWESCFNKLKKQISGEKA